MKKFDDLSVTCRVEFGKTTISIKKLKEIEVGTVLNLDQFVDESIPLKAEKSGQTVANGKMMRKDGEMYFLVSEVEI